VAVEVRTVADDGEYAGALNGIWHYFGRRGRQVDVERFSPILPAERLHAAFLDGQIVGGAGAYDFETTVPGGAQVPTAGVMAVGVLPTHRRRGVLRELMRVQLHAAHERGEPIAMLYASEGAIYGRYGYGLASLAGDIALPKEHARLRARNPVAEFRILDGDEEALEALPPIYDRAQRQYAGMFTRTPDWWRVRRFSHGISRGGGGEPVRVLATIDGEDVGYALYRLNFGAEHLTATTTLQVAEAIGATNAGLEEIWRYLLEIDWVARIEGDCIPLDHPLFLWLQEPRRMLLTVFEALWVRVLDVEAALAARALDGDGDVVLEISDDLCPWNARVWRVDGGGASPTDDDADLRLTINELGAVYLSGFTFDQLARAGHVQELRDGAVERADRLFRTSRQPWCPEIF
jgi:predicted acetyltransferase